MQPRAHALVLAGGTATRLGGGDKPLRELGTSTVLAHLLDRLRPQCGAAVLISANGAADRFAAFGTPVVGDATEDRGAGPLAGVLAGLDWIARERPAFSLALIVPGDTPFLPPDLLDRLAAARHGRGVASAASGGRLHLLTGLWPVDLRHDLQDALRNDGIRQVGRFLQRHPASTVEWSTQPFDPFLNINRPEDLAAARAIVSR